MNRGAALLLVCLLCFAQGAEARRLDRGLGGTPAVIAPKGSWTFGGSAGFESASCNDYDFLVVSGINSTTLSFAINPQFCIMFADNMGLGCKFGASRSLADIRGAEMAVKDISLSVKDYYTISQKYSVAPFFRYYLPLGSSGRFAAVADARLLAGYSEGKRSDGHIPGEVRGVFARRLHFSAGVDTGLIAFLTRHLAVGVSVGLLSFNYSREVQTRNLVYEGVNSFSSGNFMVDLFSLSFGIHCYL